MIALVPLLLAAAPGDPVVVWLDRALAPARGVVKAKVPCLEIEWTGGKGFCSPKLRELSPKREVFPSSVAPSRLVPSDAKKRYRDLQPGDEVQRTLHADSICDEDYTLTGKVTERLDCVTVKRTDFKWPDLTVRADDAISVRPDGGTAPGFGDLEAVVKAHRDEERACVTQHPPPQPDSWSVTLMGIVLPDGSLTKVEVDTSYQVDEELPKCLRALAAGWRFPASAEGMRAQLAFNPSTVK